MNKCEKKELNTEKNNELQINKTKKISSNKNPLYKVVFMGTSFISDACLQTIKQLPIQLVLVVTKPDKLGNRNRVTIPEVKKTCLEENIPFIQPNKLSECYDLLVKLQPNFLITCSFGKIVPDLILKVFQKCINVHTSLLPAYRGASPIQAAIKNMDKVTGISLMEMISELDAGKVYWQNHIDIDKNETYDSLLKKFCNSFNDDFLMAIKRIFDNKLIGTEQNVLIQNGHILSYAPIITKDMYLINWMDTASKIDAHIRSLFSKPLAQTRYENITIKIFKSSVVKYNNDDVIQRSWYQPGTIVNIDKKGILVSTIISNECVLIEQLQLPGKNPMHVSQLINGNHPFKKNVKFF